MKKRNLVTFSISVLSLFFAFTTTAYAALVPDSMETFSYSKYLPIVIGGTLIIEAIVIMLLSDIKRIVNVSYSVLVANLVSFVITRLSFGLIKGKIFFVGMYVFGNNPKKWIAALICLAVALATELPIIYFMLRPFTKKRIRLMFAAAAANIITALATVLFEIYLYNSLIS